MIRRMLGRRFVASVFGIISMAVGVIMPASAVALPNARGGLIMKPTFPAGCLTDFGAHVGSAGASVPGLVHVRWFCKEGNAQLWHEVYNGRPGGVQLVNNATARCLDSNYYGSVYTLPCNGGDFQEWSVWKNGRSSAEIATWLMGNSLQSDWLGDVSVGVDAQNWQ